MKKILMLSMSCNDPYYQSLLGAVRNTWAKPLIKGKYPNISWFAYTACDEKHPKPFVDIKNHMIYVDCGDGLFDTYEKTQKAYAMVKNLVDFDYVIRTNTSLFINIDNMLKRLENVENHHIIGRCVNSGLYEPGTTNIRISFWLLAGFFFGMNRYLFDICMSADKKLIQEVAGSEKLTYYDDDIISLMLHLSVGNDFPTVSIEEDLDDYLVTFRTTQSQEYLDSYHFKLEDNPDVINDRVIVRLRDLWANTEERGSFAREVQNFYEMYEHLKPQKHN